MTALRSSSNALSSMLAQSVTKRCSTIAMQKRTQAPGSNLSQTLLLRTFTQLINNSSSQQLRSTAPISISQLSPSRTMATTTDSSQQTKSAPAASAESSDPSATTPTAAPLSIFHSARNLRRAKAADKSARVMSRTQAKFEVLNTHVESSKLQVDLTGINIAKQNMMHGMIALMTNASENDRACIARMGDYRCADSAQLHKGRKHNYLIDYSKTPGDCGNALIAIAGLTDRIRHLERYIPLHRNDVWARTNHMKLVQRRRKLLKNLRRKDGLRYEVAMKRNQIDEWLDIDCFGRHHSHGVAALRRVPKD